MLSTKSNLQRTSHLTSLSKLSNETLFWSCQDESESIKGETAFTYEKFTFVLFIDEYTSEDLASSLTFEVFDQYGYKLSKDIEMKKGKGTSYYERRATFQVINLYERTVSVQYKFYTKDHHNRIEDFFVYIGLSRSNVTKPDIFASCVVVENDYHHDPVLLHLEMPCLTSAESPPLIIGIFRAIIDSNTTGSHGDWIYKNESCSFQAFESFFDDSMSIIDKKELNTTNEDCFGFQKDALDSYKEVREKLTRVRKRIIGKSKRTVFYTITKEDLIDFFLLPRDEVAQELGICVTLLKKICRKNGIKQWPYRRLKNVDARLNSLRRLLATPDLVSKNRDKFCEEFHLLSSEREKILHGNE
ncbi:hypothetical protein GpartN1_g4961.t1 [Galdieria partita]|uniref:RWP-RK domain-containing protein n=1 Tax=Galdieria partita TaxID=83374 RepID=A0A9C7PVP1_9RHOD|nr:hypothetical protein GpartN1_g2623.t1 [Galdieria partita]GJQ13170.1 hypothetical protein GpartN1_g4961.t1 [Galdieria partita]